MHISIVIAVLNSHKVLARQIRHFKKIDLRDDIEIIIMDDGSNPPLKVNSGGRNIKVYQTNDKRPWTQGLARNKGAKIAQGKYLFFTDIDHIITKEAIDVVRNFNGDRMIFPRYFGIFDRYGNILTDEKTLVDFGLKNKYVRRGLSGGHHGNTYAIKKTIFEELNGYDRKYCDSGFHVGKKFMSEERDFNRRFSRKYRDTNGPKIYVYPIGKFQVNGDENPRNLFHNLSREQVPQPMKE